MLARCVYLNLLGLLVLGAVLGACADTAVPQLPPTPAPVGFTLLAEALAAGAPAAKQPITLAGYAVASAEGVVLAEGLSFGEDGSAHIRTSGAAPVWLGANASLLPNRARTAGAFSYAPVLVRGALEGPGAYGPAGGYRYQIAAPTLQPWPPVETSLAALLEQPQDYTGRLVRLAGGLLVRDGASLLVDKLGAGGIPAQHARQIKLRGGAADPALLAQLTQAPGGAVRFGQVQVEGVLRGGLLVPLSITMVR